MLYPRFRADEISASTGKEHGKLWQYILSLESARMDGRRARGGSEVHGRAASQVRRGGSEWGRVGTGSTQSPSVAYSPKYRKLDSGTESEVFDTGDGWVVKVRQIHPLSIGDVIDELAKVVYHNYLFPGEKYVLDDIVRHEHDGYREFYLILRQPFVTPKTENGRIVLPTYAQIWQLMKSRPQGFTFMDLSSRPAETGEYGDYSSSDGDEGEVVPAVKKVAYNRQFVVYDFQPGRNTFIDAKTGKVRFIDPRIDINDPGAGFRYSKYGTRRKFDGEVDFDKPELGVREKQTELSGGTSRNQNPSGNEYGRKWKIFRPGTRNVDIGAGRFDKATQFLADIGVENIPFDPVNRDGETNRRAAESVRANPADTATVHNVLNVIDNDSVMEGIVNQAARAIKKNGSAIFTIYEGNRSGVGARTRDGYQRNAKARSYEPTIKKFFGSVETHGNVILARRPKDIGPAFWAFDSSFENGINFDTPEFDPERFGKLVTGVGKLVDVLVESGHRDFKSLATYIYERDAEKYGRAKPVLQDIWNAVARARGLSRVGDAEAERVYGMIGAREKAAEHGADSRGPHGVDAAEPIASTAPDAEGGTAPGTPESPAPVRANVQFGSYNQRRYSRPWIAKVTAWEVGKAPELDFGDFVGDDGGGTAEVKAIPGDVVRYGQRDYRGNGTTKQYGIVQPDGSVANCSDEEAAEAFRANAAEGRAAGRPAESRSAARKTAEKSQGQTGAEAKGASPKSLADVPPAKPRKSDGKIADVGEKIAGARKDLIRDYVAALNDATKEQLAALPFAKAFRKPDLAKSVATGALREKDALFYETVFAGINTAKPRLKKRDETRKRYIPGYRSDLDKWVDATYDALDALKKFLSLDEAGRDAMIESAHGKKFLDVEADRREIARIRSLNEGRVVTSGECYTPNQLYVMSEALRRIGYRPGDRIEFPYKTVKPSSTFEYYRIEDESGDYIALPRGATLDDAIDEIVYLARLNRGDTDLEHPDSAFSGRPTGSVVADTGRHVVYWGGTTGTSNSRVFDGKDEAEAFAQKRKGAAVFPEKKVTGYKDYRIVFTNPITRKQFLLGEETFATKEAAQSHFAENREQMDELANDALAKERGVERKRGGETADSLLVVSLGRDGRYAVGEKDRPYAEAIRTFKTHAEAVRFKSAVKDGYFAKWKEAQEKRKAFVFFDTGDERRIGEDWRGGRDVTAEDFRDTFGFRGVQFGNWTNQADRQMAVNQAYDAFRDLAKLIGIPDRAISLNGELGIAFGARDSGNAAAHYEPKEVVINITKTHGAGSLAHEWWHALDNYLSRAAGVKMGMVSDGSVNVRPEVKAAFDDLISRIKESGYGRRSKKQGAYWRRPHEMTARLLAEWVDRELKRRGEANTFLSRGTNAERTLAFNYELYRAQMEAVKANPVPLEDFRRRTEAYEGFPYPTDAEVAEFSDGVRRVFDALNVDGDVLFDTPELGEDANARREYDAVVARYTNADGTKKPGWMKAPNGKPTKLTERQWVQVRTPSFKKWFGDWEGKAVADAILGDADIVVENGILDMPPKEQRAAAKALYNELKAGGPVVTMDGRSVRFTGVGFKEIKQHSADPHTLAIVPILRNVIATAHYFGEGDAVVENGNKLKYHLYAKRVNVGDGSMIARIVLRKDVNGNVFYDEELSSVEDFREIADSATRKPNAEQKPQSPHAPHSIAEFFAGINPASVSKVVDENGEPCVVWHGSEKRFSEFSNKLIGSHTDANGHDGVGVWGRGHYFSDRKDLAEEYQRGNPDGQTIATFLNIRNPMPKEEVLRIANEAWDYADPDGKNYYREYQRLIDESVRKNDYDGVIANGKHATAYVAFSPNQVKSATGNSGDFSRTNPDIRFDSPELSAGAQYDPRSRIPNVRGGWTEGKILRYLKATPSLHGVRAASRLIAEFASPEELKEHMFYHGTKASVSGLSPSITKSEEWAERHGGGGYGTRYWGVSVSKSKRVASSFGGHSPGVSIYPVVLAKGAKVVDRADLADADDVSDHIVELWNDGVDAVRLGDWKEDFSEQELLILNPRAICNVGTPDYYRQFRLWSPENPLNIKDDAQIAEVYEAAREYAGYSPFARFGKPTPPKMFENGELKPKEVRDAERAQYEKELEAWRSSEQGRAAEAYESNARNVIRFDSPELAPEARAREIASFTQRYYSRQRGLQRLAKPSADDFMDAAEGRWAKFRRIVQDKNLVIREVEERLGVTDKRESVYYAKDREFGLNEYQLGELQKRRVDPILDRLAETGASQRDFDLYLIARHAPYRNAVLRERGVTDGAGMGDAEAAEVIEGFNRLGVGDEFAAIADMVYAMNDEALQRRVDSGRVSPEEAETLRRTLVDYVPLRTDMENDERDAHNTYSSGWHQSEFRTAHGRRTLADSPLAWSIVQAERSIRDANANRVRQTAAALVRKSAAMGKPIGEIIPGTQVRRRWAFNIGGEVLTLEELRDRTDLIFFKEDGKLKAIRMNVGAHGLGNTFAQAVTDKDLVKFSKWFEWVPRLTRAMSAMRTQYVPTFIVRNLKADHLEVFFNVGSERGIVGGAKFFGRLVANEWRNRRDVRDYFRDGELRGRMKEFVENGGLTGGGMAAEGFSEAARRVDHTLRTTRGGVARKVAAAIPDAISLLNACAEFNTRVGVFSALRDEGVGVEDAVSYARDATVNFNRRGSLTPYLNAAFMFSNAAIQGLGRAFKSMRSEHGKQMVTLLFLVGFLQSLLDHFLGRDEDREKKGLSSARNLSEHEKQSTIGIPLLGGLRLKTQIRNPWALPMYAGRKAGELLMGWIDGRTAVADLASAVGGFVTEPVGGNGFGSVPEAMQTFAPTLLDPFVQWATGVDFKGDRRLRKNYSDHLPDSWNGRINTPDVYKWISQGANAISGGSRFRKGAFDTSPENWQLLAETVLGGALADLNRAVSTVNDARLAALGAKPEQVLRDVSFVRDTLTNLPDVSSRYYDALSDYEADRTEYSGLARTDAGKAEAFAASHPWADGSKNPVVDIVWNLGRAVQEAKTPSDAAKLRREQLAAMAGFVRRMEEARKAGKRKVNR